jgi:hypothetical protein
VSGLFAFWERAGTYQIEKAAKQEDQIDGRSSDTRKVKEKSFPGRLGRSDCTAIGGAGEVGRAKACGMVRHDKNRLEDLQWQLLPLYLEQNQFHFRADF